jgi:heat shock protein HslJ
MAVADPAASGDGVSPQVRQAWFDRVAAQARPIEPGCAAFGDATDSPGRYLPRRIAVMAAAIAVVVAVAVAAVAITSGHDDRQGAVRTPASALYGLRWSDPQSSGSAIFRPGQVELSDGCTETVYRLDIAGDRLEVASSGMIVRTCGGGPIGPGPGAPGYPQFQRRLRALARFQAVLASGPTWSIDDETLTLTAPTGASVQLTVTTVVPSQLPGSSWTLQVVGTLHSTGTSGAFEGPTLTFGNDGSFHATDPCDSLTGTAHITAHAITFSGVHKKVNDCPPTNRAETVETIDTMLTSTVDYTLFDDSLLLRLPGTDGMLNYRSSP